jgi:excisionase family DNA binding protein
MAKSQSGTGDVSLLTVSEAARHRGVTPQAIRDAIRRGEIAAVRLETGRREFRIPLAEVEGWHASYRARDRGGLLVDIADVDRLRGAGIVNVRWAGVASRPSRAA